MDDSIPRCIALCILILLCAIMAATETAYTNCNRIRLKTLAEEANNKRAKRAVGIIESFDHALVALLIGQNLVSVSCSAIGTVLFVSLLKDEAAGSLVATAVLTVVVFLIGETIPKNIANANSDSFAMFFSLPLKILIFILTPFTYIFTFFSDLLRKKITKGKKEPSMTEDEFQSVIETIEDEGVLEHNESRIIKSAVGFGDKTVKEIMCPREDIVAVEINTSPEILKSILLNLSYSRIPVYDKTIDNIVGILRAKQLLEGILNGHTALPDVKLITPIRIKPDAKLDTLFEEMGRRRTHIAIVTENNTTLGLVTMEDILEELVGEIYDEDEDVDPKEIEKEFLEEEFPDKAADEEEKNDE